jgi:hypothetical protein
VDGVKNLTADKTDHADQKEISEIRSIRGKYFPFFLTLPQKSEIITTSAQPEPTFVIAKKFV